MKCPYCGHDSEEKICPKCYAEKPEKKTTTKKSSKEE